MNPIGIIGTEWIRVEPEAGGFAGKLKGMLGGGGPIGAKFGLEVAVGVGVGLFAIGEKFNTLYNTVAVRTGATGKVLDGLKGSVNNVLSGTAGSFKQVGDAVSLLYTRTGLTGGALEKLAKQQVTLARITKTDVGENVDATTKLFAKYGIAAKDQSRELDVLFKASQQAGVGIGDIIQPMLKGGAALQQFGFGVDKSAALIASLTKAGVNVQPALMSLRTAFAKIAKEGGDPVKVLHNLEKALTDGKNPALAMKEAMGLLGARGGLELANAIKTGKFSLDAMLKAITDGKGGIAATGVAVSTIGGKFQLLKNQALVAIQPIATAVYDFANHALGNLVAWINRSGGLTAIFEKWKVPILAAAGALLALISPFTAVAVGLGLLYAKNETFRNAVNNVANVIRTNFIPVIQAIGQWIMGTAVPALQAFADFMVNKVWPVVQQVAGYIAEQFTHLVGAVQSRWDDIKTAISNVLMAIKVAVAIYLAPIFFVWKHFHDQIMAVVSTVWNLIKAIIQNALQIVQGVIDIVLGVLSGHWSRAWNGIKEVLGGVWNLIVAIVKGAVGVVWQVIQAGLKLAGTVVSKGLDAIVRFFQDLPGRIKGMFVGAGKWLYNIGADIVQGLIGGINSMLGQLATAVTNLQNKVPGHSFLSHLPGGNLFGHAAGGASVRAGQPFIVGEVGPELFVPSGSGTIVPHNKLGGAHSGIGGGTVVNITLAPTFPPGMNPEQAMAHMQAFTEESIARHFESLVAGGRVGTGTNR